MTWPLQFQSPAGGRGAARYLRCRCPRRYRMMLVATIHAPVRMVDSFGVDGAFGTRHIRPKCCGAPSATEWVKVLMCTMKRCSARDRGRGRGKLRSDCMFFPRADGA